MADKLAKIVVIFGITFLMINAIGYCLNINELKTVAVSPNGFNRSTSNIPTILSSIFTLIIYTIKYFKNK